VSSPIKRIIFSILLVVVSLTFVLLILKTRNTSIISGKKRVCPDAWIDNQMPSVKDDKTVNLRQYFVIDGERQEMGDYDLDWIRINCNIKPQTVY